MSSSAPVARPGVCHYARHMARKRNAIGVLLTVAVLATPATAAGQGAVDEQYRDPFAGRDNGDSQTAEPAPTEDTAPSTAPAAQSPSGAAAESAATPSGAAELPRTGLPGAPLAIAALAFVGAGLALRRRLRSAS